MPPRVIIDALCVRLEFGRWAAQSVALPGLVTGGISADDAAQNLRRLAEGIVGEPVTVLVTVLDDGAVPAAAYAVEGA